MAGIVVVVAAGNEGRNNVFGTEGYGTINSPGNHPLVITVGAMKAMMTASRADDVIASYSSKGPTQVDHVVKPDIVAPGNRVISALVPNSSFATSYPDNIVANLILSTAVAHWVYVGGGDSRVPAWPAALLMLAAIAYWVVNTGTLSVLMALLGEGSVVSIGAGRYSLPFHLAGAAVAILMSSPLQQGDWRIAILFGLVIAMASLYYACLSSG
jgi:subtilisin family serine protease